MIILRFILSFNQFIWLAHLPILMSPWLASCFVLCLRLGLLATPLWVKFTGKSAILYAVLGVGLFEILTSFSQSLWLGSIGLSLMLSTAAFLIRNQTAKAVASASFNKVALHAGSLIAGVVAFYSLEYIPYFYYAIASATIFSLFIAFNLYSHEAKDALKVASWKGKTLNFGLSWFLIGVAMGFRSYAPFVILPTFMRNFLGELPGIYGVWMVIYSFLVILWQIPSARGFHSSYSSSIKFLIGGCITISCLTIPGVISSYVFILIWLFFISSQELFAASLDVAAHKDEGLYMKEIGVAFGGGISVTISQIGSGPILVGLLGIICLIIANAIKLYGQKIEKVQCPIN